MKKRINLKIYKLLIKYLGFKRQRKNKPLLPMGVKTYYPPGYVPPVKRILSDGTIDYYISAEALKNVHEAWNKLGKDTIKGSSLSKIIISDSGDEVESIIDLI